MPLSMPLPRDAQGRAVVRSSRVQDPAPVGRPPSWQLLKKQWGVKLWQVRIATVRAHLADGCTEFEVVQRTGWEIKEIRAIIEGMVVEEETTQHGALNLKPGEAYLRYMLRMGQAVKDLDVLIKEGKGHGAKALHAMVGAVKAKVDIFERVLKMGQDMGLVQRAPKEHHHVAILLNMEDKELRTELRGELKNLKRLMASGCPWDGHGVKNQLVQDAEFVVASGEKALVTSVGPSMPDMPAVLEGPGAGRPARAKGGIAKRAGAARIRRIKTTRGAEQEFAPGPGLGVDSH